jgi:hypothetical protein
MKTCVDPKTCKQMFISVLVINAKTQKHPITNHASPPWQKKRSLKESQMQCVVRRRPPKYSYQGMARGRGPAQQAGGLGPAKGFRLYESTYVTSYKRQHCKDRKQISAAGDSCRAGKGQGWLLRRKVLGVMELFCIFVLVVVIRLRLSKWIDLFMEKGECLYV